MDPEYINLAFPNIIPLTMTCQNESILTMLKDVETSRSEFIFYADRLFRTLLEMALNELPFKTKKITTVSGNTIMGKSFVEEGICAVSTIRSGEAMELAFREVCRGIRVGKMLIDSAAGHTCVYKKVPSDIRDRWVLILDPVISSGDCMMKVVEELEKDGVNTDKMIFVNLFVSTEGLKRLHRTYPTVKVVSANIDEKLEFNSETFSKKYYGTD